MLAFSGFADFLGNIGWVIVAFFVGTFIGAPLLDKLKAVVVGPKK